jgi:hypothetical protein
MNFLTAATIAYNHTEKEIMDMLNIAQFKDDLDACAKLEDALCIREEENERLNNVANEKYGSYREQIRSQYYGSR